jgi:signal peptidase I
MKDFGDSEMETPPEKGAAGGEHSSETGSASEDDRLLLPPPSSSLPLSLPPPPQAQEPIFAPPAFRSDRESTEEAPTAFGSPPLAGMQEAAGGAMGEEAGRPRRIHLPASLVVLIGLALLTPGVLLLVLGSSLAIPKGTSVIVIWYGTAAIGGAWVIAGTVPLLAGRKMVDISLLWEVLETVVLAVLIFLAVHASFQNFRVEGLSMSPSLSNGQHLLVNKLAYATIDTEVFDWVPFFDPGEDSVHHIFGTPGRGDVIVFVAPSEPDRDFIKRIIGVSGDHIELTDGNVVLNGEVLEELYTQGSTICTTGACVWDVQEGYYFVMGDNRQGSKDSRVFGPITEESIIGKAFISYWPLDNVGLAPNHSISYANDQAGAAE